MDITRKIDTRKILMQFLLEKNNLSGPITVSTFGIKCVCKCNNYYRTEVLIFYKEYFFIIRRVKKKKKNYILSKKFVYS